VARRFCEAVAGDQVKLMVIPGMRHEGAWDRLWKDVVFPQTVQCARETGQ